MSDEKCGKLIAKDGWLMCPKCGRGKVLRLNPKTRATSLVVYCKHCGMESIVNIDECLCLSACAT
nr:MAG TPA: transposase-like protein [Caudoviricetes sp.]